jgi:serine/threonine protein kinase
MERIFGDSVMSKVIENGPLSEEQTKPIMRQLLQAVDYMHERKVVHRDLNPTNLFV